ncbi:V-type ATP synthase subunit I [Aerococcus christensenii]|uniref:V-type ATPase subunit family protein n=1 Tax=Aerococcus christensenii TaxID=87541 RepID=A0A133XYM7_9LACT|nr:V-type ATPase 116kDa subunit family protein [Aerococcus christensenii]KXB36036.1 V-type ATPase subunit family protein [Aerococcus christensenii]MDK8234407.1 V-type ATPase 116kDa subunit family protein [Aerococcus christensenii]
MITKMSMVNITGPRDDIDRMSDQYLSHYDIHLENTLKELSDIRTLKPYTSPDPYKPLSQRIDDLLQLSPTEQNAAAIEPRSLDFDYIKRLVEQVEHDVKTEQEKLQKVNQEITQLTTDFNKYEPFEKIDYPLDDILIMKKVKFRFGRFTLLNYHKYKKYIENMVPAIFIPSKKVDGYVYGAYFTSAQDRQRVDALFFSLNWKRLYLPEEKGTFVEILSRFSEKMEELKKEQKQLETTLRQAVQPISKELLEAKARLAQLSKAFGVRRYAAITRNEFAKKETRYLLIGWMAETDAAQLVDQMKDDPNVTIYLEDYNDGNNIEPPTKLKNNFFTKPFRMITKMYGTPNYEEFDPTPLVALTYSLMFGAMFGDVGHGLLLMILGILGYIKKNLSGAKMFVPVGISSMIFGFLYGSIFGLEDVLPAIWLKPSEAMTSVPFFGTLNSIFIVSVCFGMFLILLTMTMNVYMRLKEGEKLEAIFDRNGVMGLIFYGLLVITLVLYMTGHAIPAFSLVLLVMLIALACIGFKEKIIHLITKSKEKSSDGIVIQLITVFFEAFETLLSFISNTISFVRVGAFAISHGVMMGIVLMFAHLEGGHPNWLVFILGNLFVTGFEGLVVFIQVLRLEFYELFSHFFKGDGIEFKSIWS